MEDKITKKSNKAEELNLLLKLKKKTNDVY
jgi:hypothetical protein